MVTSRNAEAVAVRAWARRVVETRPGLAPLDIVGAVVVSVAEGMGLSGRSFADRHQIGLAAEPGGESPPMPEPPGGWANVWLPGAVHEQAVSLEDRSARGAWYTPEAVVRGLVGLATVDGVVPSFAVDPTCGGGAFLLALLDRLVELGRQPARALTEVAGLDIDRGAVDVSRWSIGLWAERNGVAVTPADIDVSIGDALVAYPEHWPSTATVVGNPPFATPLRTGAVRAKDQAFRDGREHLLGPYTDLAAMHLLGAIENSTTGSVVVLVQPQSVLSGRDTRALRDHCDEVAPIHGLWAAREPVFDAGVRACAAVLKPGTVPPDTVRLASGPDVAEVGLEVHRPGLWSVYAARALGAPVLPPRLTMVSGPSAETGRLGSIVTATAGFRDEYYGLVEACREWDGPAGAEPNRLITVGAVEPLATKWGADECRFGRRRWLRPWIDIDSLQPKVRAWTERQSQPKIVLATQSRVLEPVIDRTGGLVPATPLIAVHAPPDDLDLVAAVLLAPPVVAWAWQRWFGAALAVDALKLAARQVLDLPLPEDRRLWEEAGRLIADASIESVDDGWETSREVATIMNRAYRADESVLHWWFRRAGRPGLPGAGEGGG